MVKIGMTGSHRLISGLVIGAIIGLLSLLPFHALAASEVTITVIKTGDGLGGVTGSGISCGSTCSITVPVGTPISLNAVVGSQSYFVGWSGGPCTGSGACAFTATDSVTIYAKIIKEYRISLDSERTGTIPGYSAVTFQGTVLYEGIEYPVNCTSPCSFGSDKPLVFNITVNAGPKTTFVGWNGAGCTGNGACSFTAAPYTTTVKAQVLPDAFPLSVSMAGIGSGQVYLDSNNVSIQISRQISCGTICSADVLAGTTFTLFYTLMNPYSKFEGWSGACTGTDRYCTVTMSEAKQVTANFGVLNNTLVVTNSDIGSGTVTGGGIDCGTVCTRSFAANTSVTLTATPSSDSVFFGWDGYCSGSGSCTVPMNQNRDVYARFSKKSHTLSVLKSGRGNGFVYGYYPDGQTYRIHCGDYCSSTFLVNQQATLTASPPLGNVFTGWSGACTGTGPCVITMDSEKTVTANFEPEYRIQVVKIGQGTVSGGPIACGSNCNLVTDTPATFNLTAIPAAHSTFRGWYFGSCPGAAGPNCGRCSGNASCTVVLSEINSQTKSDEIRAVFDAESYQLSVISTGTGKGEIQVSGHSTCPAQESCGYPYISYGELVTLNASPSSKSRFRGWSGACTGLGPCTITMTEAKMVTANFSKFSAHDFDGNGKADILWRNLSSGNTVVSLMNGVTPDWKTVALIGPNVKIQAVGDFNGDGFADILWRNMTTGNAMISFMQGNIIQSWGSVGIISFSADPFGVGDFDGDGKDDILWRNLTTGNTVISLLKGASPTWVTVGVVSPAIKIQGIGDFNGDGKADVLWRNMTTGEVSMSLMNGGVPDWHTVGTVGLNAVVQGIGDFDGNGKSDVLWRNTSTGNMSAAFMNGPLATYQNITVVALNVAIQGIGDYNGDGKDDILWRNTTTGNAVISFMNGASLTWGVIGILPFSATIQ